MSALPFLPPFLLSVQGPQERLCCCLAPRFSGQDNCQVSLLAHIWRGCQAQKGDGLCEHRGQLEAVVSSVYLLLCICCYLFIHSECFYCS